MEDVEQMGPVEGEQTIRHPIVSKDNAPSIQD